MKGLSTLRMDTEAYQSRISTFSPRNQVDIHYSCDPSGRGVFARSYHYQELLFKSARERGRKTTATNDHQAIIDIAWRWRLQHLRGLLALKFVFGTAVHTKTSSSRTLSPIVKEILDCNAELSHPVPESHVLTHDY